MRKKEDREKEENCIRKGASDGMCGWCTHHYDGIREIERERRRVTETAR